MRRILPLALALMALPYQAWAQASNPEPSDAPPIAYVEKLAGRVLVDAGEGFAEIAERASLFPGDRVALLRGSSARLSYGDVCEANLTERTIHVVAHEILCGENIGTGTFGEDAEHDGGGALEAIVGSHLIFEELDLDYTTPENIGRLRPIGP